MLHSTRGIVLKTVKYSENSIIAKIYTEQFGLRSYIVKGLSGKSNQGKKALLQGLTLLDMVVYEKATGNLQNIKEMESAYAFRTIPFDISKSTILIFVNEVLFKCIAEEVANSPMFQFIFDQLIKLDESTGNISNFHLHFLIMFTKFLGFIPRNNYSEKNQYFDLQEGEFIAEIPFHNNFLEKDLSRQMNNLLDGKKLNFSGRPQERNELLKKIILYYSLHVPSFGDLKSTEVLKQVFN